MAYDANAFSSRVTRVTRVIQGYSLVRTLFTETIKGTLHTLGMKLKRSLLHLQGLVFDSLLSAGMV
jgi:hypothetical protein